MKSLTRMSQSTTIAALLQEFLHSPTPKVDFNVGVDLVKNILANLFRMQIDGGQYLLHNLMEKISSTYLTNVVSF